MLSVCVKIQHSKATAVRKLDAVDETDPAWDRQFCFFVDPSKEGIDANKKRFHISHFARIDNIQRIAGAKESSLR